MFIRHQYVHVFGYFLYLILPKSADLWHRSHLAITHAAQRPWLSWVGSVFVILSNDLTIMLRPALPFRSSADRLLLHRGTETTPVGKELTEATTLLNPTSSERSGQLRLLPQCLLIKTCLILRKEHAQPLPMSRADLLGER